MCELLGSEPKDDEIPVDRSDLNIDTQLVLSIFDKLQSNWEGMSGHYLGKDLSLIPTLLEHYKFDESLAIYTWEIIPIIDNIISEDIAEKIKRKQKTPETTPKGM